MPELKKVSRDVLEQLGAAQRIYTTRNPVVRWIFWQRLAELLKLVDDRAMSVVLDCGCGEGALLPTLSAHAETVHAVDLEPAPAAALCVKMGLTNVTVLRASIDRLPFPDETFDAVFSADVLEHIPTLEPAITELYRVTKPGGALFVSAPTENMLYQVGRKVFGFKKPPDHYRNARDIEQLVSQAFTVRRKRYFPLNMAEALSGFVLIEARKTNLS